METVIRLENLSKTYGRGENAVHAVKGLSLSIESGQVYGFLGPNGAGKTTTIRMLLNLIYPTSGDIYLFDTPRDKMLPILHEKVGALVEEATFYPFMSGFDNLKLLARSGNYRKNRITDVLELVGMRDYADRKTKTYSTGMKQRLGVAAALLNNPELLILDEPTAGLDPGGIQEMRNMLQHLAKNEGKTVFLSSHLLYEIEQICDRVAIINKGQLVQEGNVAELIGSASLITIKANPIEKAQVILSDHVTGLVHGDSIEITANHDEIPGIIEKLVDNGVAIYEVRPKQRSLEDLFLEVTHD